MAKIIKMFKKVITGIIALSVILVVAGVIFNACKKGEIFAENKKISDSAIPFTENPYPIEKYLSNPEDIDDEILDKQLYEIGLTARHLFKNTNLNRFIIENANKSANDCIDLRDFKSWSPVISGIKTGEYTDEIVNKLQKTLESTNLQYISKKPEIAGEVEHYIPALFVVNIDNADPNKMPIFSPGIFVNEELPGMEGYEDHIVIWYFDPAKGDFIEAILSEEMALTITNPIFIVDNADEAMTKRQKTTNNNGNVSKVVYCIDPNVTAQMKKSYYASYEYQINTRSETVGKSELCAVLGAIDEYGGGVHWVNNSSGWHLIAKVAKNDVGKLMSSWVTFCRVNSTAYPDFVPFGCNYIFWNTFERDWAKSQKPLGNGTANGKTVNLGGNMKYSSDWYAYNPAYLQGNHLNLAYIFNNWAKMHENTWSKLRIWRID